MNWLWLAATECIRGPVGDGNAGLISALPAPCGLWGGPDVGSGPPAPRPARRGGQCAPVQGPSDWRPPLPRRQGLGQEHPQSQEARSRRVSFRLDIAAPCPPPSSKAGISLLSPTRSISHPSPQPPHPPSLHACKCRPDNPASSQGKKDLSYPTAATTRPAHTHLS